MKVMYNNFMEDLIRCYEYKKQIKSRKRFQDRPLDVAQIRLDLETVNARITRLKTKLKK